jgi:hypothetical protein
VDLRAPRALIACALWAAALAAGAGLRALHAAEPDVEIRVEGKGNSVSAALEGPLTALDVRSQSGLGRAHVEVHGDPSRPLSLRLHLRALEEFALAYADVRVVAAVSGSEDHAVIQRLQRGGGATLTETPIEPTSPFWLEVTSVPEAGYIAVRPPADFRERRARSFSIAWVDAFR